MGLAASQSKLLLLTARKSTCERDITLFSLRKMQCAREMSELSQEYNSKLSQKNLVYYANGKYNKINYNYLMGYGSSYFCTFDGSRPLKENNNVVLTDYTGRVVLSSDYANAIMSVLGNSVMNSFGQGSTFSEDKIPEILAALCPPITAEEFQNGVSSHEWNAATINALTGETTGTTRVDSTDNYNSKIQSIVDFYLPIFKAAAANGWTTEYNHQMSQDSDYISDAITSGILQLAQVNDCGQYEPDRSLTYFVMNGDFELRTDADAREEVTAWYNSERERINNTEQYWDLRISNLSMEVEAIKTEIQSIESFKQDAMQIFNWCGNA